jgi:hypothetical protein
MLALRISSTRSAERVALADREPTQVSFQGSVTVGSVVFRADKPLAGNLWPDFLFWDQLPSHRANTFDDWEPLDVMDDPVTALAETTTPENAPLPEHEERPDVPW